MTQQYLAGEFSSMLRELQTVVTNGASARDLAPLRHEAETSMPALSSLTVRALVLTADPRWDSLTRADAPGLARQAALGAELHDFGVCAGVLEGD